MILKQELFSALYKQNMFLEFKKQSRDKFYKQLLLTDLYFFYFRAHNEN